MQVTNKNLAKSELLLTVELSVDEMKQYMEKGAKRLSTEKAIEGFRGGMAPLDVVIKKFGEMPVMEAAAEEAVRATFPKIVAEQKLLTVGAPSIGVTKMAPGNPFIYTATVTLLPSVELCDLSKISVSAKQLTVSDIDVAKSVKDLRTMRATETVTTNAAGMQDKVVIDMDMKLGGVSLEGGQAKGHQVYLSEPYYIPGLTDQLLGLKKDDAKTFTLTFPKEHYQKNVAGKPVDFEIKVTDVFERTLPAHDDAFAQTLGQKTVAELDTLIRENLLKEAQDKENQRQEIAALEEVVKHSKFGDLPDLLVNEEVLRMIEEMKAGISQRGMDWQQYLDQAKKTELQLKLDFTAQAIQRIKVALVVRALAAKDQVDVTDAEVAAEIEREMNLYSDDADMQAQIRTPEYHDRVHVVLRNRKVVESLKKQVIK